MLIESNPPPATAGQVLIAPMVRLDRWVTGHSPSADSIEQAQRLIGELTTLAQMSLTEMIVPARHPTPETPPDTDEVNALLESVRRVRGALDGKVSAYMLHSITPQLAQQLSDVRRAAMARIEDLEALLVALGAGGEGDAHLGQRFVPEVSEDPPEGGIRTFEL